MKFYTNLCQFHSKLLADNGLSLEGLFSDEQSAYDVFSQYFSKVYVCKKGVTDTYCFPKYKSWKTSGTYQPGNTTSFVMSDGAILIFNCFSTTCTGSTELNSAIGCLRIRADINGYKGPNTIGKDVFDSYLTNDKVVARGDPLTTETIDNTSGWGRGYYILTTGEL